MGGRIGIKVAPRGTIGKQIFEEVQKLTADGTLNRLAAFKQIAEASGRQVGTVAANYYRLARRTGVKLRTRRRRAAASGASQISETVLLVQQLLQQQAEEIEQLRKETEQFAKVRQLLIS